MTVATTTTSTFSQTVAEYTVATTQWLGRAVTYIAGGISTLVGKAATGVSALAVNVREIYWPAACRTAVAAYGVASLFCVAHMQEIAYVGGGLAVGVALTLICSRFFGHKNEAPSESTPANTPTQTPTPAVNTTAVTPPVVNTTVATSPVVNTTAVSVVPVAAPTV